ncbi:hypothetical protein B0H13DRAFT_2392728 [Mycena leptocephala]|nr:hypothetical protein B0H13DRAFT_2392728 [Mycena leptocephala]
MSSRLAGSPSPMHATTGDESGVAQPPTVSRHRALRAAHDCRPAAPRPGGILNLRRRPDALQPSDARRVPTVDIVPARTLYSSRTTIPMQRRSSSRPASPTSPAYCEAYARPMDLSASAPSSPSVAHYEYLGSGHSRRRRLTRALAYINNTFTVIRFTYMYVPFPLPTSPSFPRRTRDRRPMLCVLTQERLHVPDAQLTRTAADAVRTLDFPRRQRRLYRLYSSRARHARLGRTPTITARRAHAALTHPHTFTGVHRTGARVPPPLRHLAAHRRRILLCTAPWFSGLPATDASQTPNGHLSRSAGRPTAPSPFAAAHDTAVRKPTNATSLMHGESGAHHYPRVERPQQVFVITDAAPATTMLGCCVSASMDDACARTPPQYEVHTTGTPSSCGDCFSSHAIGIPSQRSAS